jgi:spoIIIJ-associated protein
MVTDAATAGVNWLTTLLAMQGLATTVTAHPVEDESGESCWLTIAEAPLSPEQVQALIGEGGAVLDSMQYLANTTLNLGKAQEEQQAFTIELAGYRAQRLEELKAMAIAAAERVLASGGRCTTFWQPRWGWRPLVGGGNPIAAWWFAWPGSRLMPRGRPIGPP